MSMQPVLRSVRLPDRTVAGFTPGPWSNGGVANEDGWGSFNQTVDSFDGYTHSSNDDRGPIDERQRHLGISSKCADAQCRWPQRGSPHIRHLVSCECEQWCTLQRDMRLMVRLSPCPPLPGRPSACLAFWASSGCARPGGNFSVSDSIHRKGWQHAGPFFFGVPGWPGDLSHLSQIAHFYTSARAASDQSVISYRDAATPFDLVLVTSYCHKEHYQSRRSPEAVQALRQKAH